MRFCGQRSETSETQPVVPTTMPASGPTQHAGPPHTHGARRTVIYTHARLRRLHQVHAEHRLPAAGKTRETSISLACRPSTTAVLASVAVGTPLTAPGFPSAARMSAYEEDLEGRRWWQRQEALAARQGEAVVGLLLHHRVGHTTQHRRRVEDVVKESGYRRPPSACEATEDKGA